MEFKKGDIISFSFKESKSGQTFQTEILDAEIDDVTGEMWYRVSVEGLGSRLAIYNSKMNIELVEAAPVAIETETAVATPVKIMTETEFEDARAFAERQEVGFKYQSYAEYLAVIEATTEAEAIASEYTGKIAEHGKRHAAQFAAEVIRFIASFDERVKNEPFASVGGCEWLRGGRYEQPYTRMNADGLREVQREMIRALVTDEHNFIDAPWYFRVRLGNVEAACFHTLTARWDAAGDAKAAWMATS